MQVIKRDGRLEKFDVSKIKLSIARASDDAINPMNSSDISNISRDIEKVILDKFRDKISYLDIRDIVESQLNKSGFENVSKSYRLQ